MKLVARFLFISLAVKVFCQNSDPKTGSGAIKNIISHKGGIEIPRGECANFNIQLTAAPATDVWVDITPGFEDSSTVYIQDQVGFKVEFNNSES